MQIIVEFAKDVDKFEEEMFGNFLEKEQEKIALKFNKIVKEDKLNYFTKKMFVIFTDFETIAMEETNKNISENEINELTERLKIPGLWLIRRLFRYVTFFMYTNDQVKMAENNGLEKLFNKEYFKLISKYDEFGYYTEGGFSVFVDSKENFENQYQGNWFYYDR